MELKNYLYMAFGIMAFIMGRNVATGGGPVGPATFTLLVIPIIGLTVLFSLDIHNWGAISPTRAKRELFWAWAA